MIDANPNQVWQEISVAELNETIVAEIIVQNATCIEPNCKNEGRKRTFYCIDREHTFLVPNHAELSRIRKVVENMELRAK